MTRQEVANILSNIPCADAVLPCAYYSWPINEAPALPYLVYYYPNDNDVLADNSNYVKVEHLTMELYSENVDFDLEDTFESVLQANHIVYSKVTVYVTSEQMYQTTYESEVIIND